jgi:tetrahydromethanopterin S-methyltransferase subunit H
MHKFNTSQHVYNIGRVQIGGQPGETPTVLIGSVFWLGQKMVQDANKGIFDAKIAEDILNKMQTLSDESGVPYIVDIVGTTTEAFKKYVSFVADHTEAPFLTDAKSPKVRMESAQFVKEIGLQDNTVYNSIYKGVQEAELQKIKELGIKTSIVLADNPKDGSFQGKMSVLDEALDMAKRAGIEQVMIDCAIPAFAPDMGITVRAIPAIKEKFGFPTGLGTGNVVTTMGWVKAHVAKEYRKGCVTATNAIMQVQGANWLMFGPAEQAEYVFPAVAVVDTYIASAAADLDTRPLSEDHPIFKMFM